LPTGPFEIAGWSLLVVEKYLPNHPSEQFCSDHHRPGGKLQSLGCEGIVSKRLGSPYRSGRSPHWMKIKNPKAPAATREAEEDWS
jgi:hypothetical protein